MSTVFCCIIFFSLVDKLVCAEEKHSVLHETGISKSDTLNGYRDIVFFRDNFIAVGTDGRIDLISKSGEKVPVDNSNKYKLNCAFSNNDILLAAGDNGTILYSSDGKSFYRAESGTNENINGITFKSGLILAGTDKGKILLSENGKSWNNINTNAKGNIISLSANNSFFIGVTDSGEIIKSFDGTNWEIKNYNKEYAGYNKFSKFKKIISNQNSIVIIGTYDDGSPSILFSSLGNVWTERIPVYRDNLDMICYLTQKPNAITYDSIKDQFILACDDGELFTLPSCSKCNEYKKISETDLNAIICVDDYLVIVGNGYSFFIQGL